MSRFLVLNFQDFGLDHHITETIQSQTLFCICCLDKKVPLLNLSTCEHAKFLENIPKSKVRTYKDVICYQCHEILKKIEVFRQQVQKSFKILEAETFDITNVDHIKTNNFETKKTVNIYLPPLKTGLYINSTNHDEQVHEIVQNTVKNKEQTAGNLGSEEKESTGITGKSTKDTGKIKNDTGKIKNDTGKIKNDTGKIKNDTGKEKQVSQIEVSIEVEKPVMIKAEVNDDLHKEEQCEEIKTNEFELVQIKTEPKETVSELASFVTVSETEIEPQSTKPKIKTVKLSKEELGQERLQLSQSPAYLKFPHRCEHCLIGFNYEANIKDHTKRKHGPKIGSITCEICLQVLYPPGSLNAHNFRHYTRYECEACAQRFTEIDAALQHYRRAHQGAPSPLACPHCRFLAKNLHQLNLHKLKHDRHACRDCGLVVGSATSLRRHMQLSHKKTTYKCRRCATVLEGEEQYIAHMRTHGAHGEGVRCGPCEVSFSSWHAYNAHLAFSSAHAAHARYKCEECGMKFSAAAHLRIHVQRRHARALRLRCPHCPKMFLLSVELKQHVRKLHNEKWKTSVIICNDCGKPYETRKHLIRHIAEAHTQEKKNKKVVKKRR